MRPIDSGAFTTADLELTPDDGMRYELVDGVLLVTPTSSRDHQRALQSLALRLLPVCPEHFEVLLGPLEFRPASRLSLLPDLMVVRCDDVGTQWTDRPLPLAVEVLSPTTHTVDQVLKRKLYEEAGVRSYWMFDPDKETLTVLELVDGVYVERDVVSGEKRFEATLPFAVEIVPADLLRSR